MLSEAKLVVLYKTQLDSINVIGKKKKRTGSHVTNKDQ